MTDSFRDLPADVIVQVNRLCNDYEAACRSSSDDTIQLDEYLKENAEFPTEFHNAAVRELLPIEIAYRLRSGRACDFEDYQRRFPNIDSVWLAHQISTRTIARGPGNQLTGTASPIPDKIGDYDIIERIGSGGMGDVYRAVHRRMDRTVALKVLRSEIAGDPQLLRRFEREAKAAAKLTHKNIVAALDAREEGGVYCLITEFIDGHDLNNIVKRDGPLSPREAVKLVLQAARGLEYAHEQGVIHRDIKPANLLRDSSGSVKILDMGLARLETASIESTEITTSGMIMGTAAYMSPEQARNTKNADERSDIYSLGCTLFFLLTGKLAFQGETAVDTILAHVNDPIPSLSEACTRNLPDWCCESFEKMVAKEPADRFQSMSELIETIKSRAGNSEPEATESMPENSETTACSTDGTIRIASSSQQINRKGSGRKRTAGKQSGSRQLYFGITGLVVVMAAAIFLLPLFQDATDPSETTVVTPDPLETTEPAGLPTRPLFASEHRVERPAGKPALQFDGSSSYVNVPDFRLAKNDALTFEAIVQVRVPQLSTIISYLGSDHTVLYQNESRTGGYHWGFGRVMNGQSILVESNLQEIDGYWNHIAGTWNGQEVDLFVNGVRNVRRDIRFKLPTEGEGVFVGGLREGVFLNKEVNDRYFAGAIDAVRISRGVRYTGQFDVPQTLEADETTIAVYKFDAGTGNSVTDSAGKNPDAIIYGAIWPLQ